MRKFTLLALAVVAIPGSLNAAPKHAFNDETSTKPKHFFKDKKWWIGESMNVLWPLLDAQSTCRDSHRGAEETNIVLGPHPSCKDVFALEAGAVGYWTFFHALQWHLVENPNQYEANLGWRIFGYTVIPVAATAVNGSAAIHNYRIPNSSSAHSDNLPSPIDIANSNAVREGLVRP